MAADTFAMQCYNGNNSNINSDGFCSAITQMGTSINRNESACAQAVDMLFASVLSVEHPFSNPHL